MMIRYDLHVCLVEINDKGGRGTIIVASGSSQEALQIARKACPS